MKIAMERQHYLCASSIQSCLIFENHFLEKNHTLKDTNNPQNKARRVYF